MHNAGHENKISKQEDESNLLDDHYLGNMPCVLQGAGTSLNFPPFIYLFIF